MQYLMMNNFFSAWTMGCHTVPAVNSAAFCLPNKVIQDENDQLTVLEDPLVLYSKLISLLPTDF